MILTKTLAQLGLAQLCYLPTQTHQSALCKGGTGTINEPQRYGDGNFSGLQETEKGRERTGKKVQERKDWYKATKEGVRVLVFFQP